MPSTTQKKPATNRSAAKPHILQSSSLKKIPWLIHGFSTRSGGHSTAYGARSLNLGFTKDDRREAVEENRAIFLRSLGATNGTKPWPLVTLRQVHSDLIHVVNFSNPGSLVADGLVSNVAGIALGILTADCFPVMLADTRHKAIGIFHAGWRGTLKRIVEKGMGVIRHEYGTLPPDITAAIGPGIQKCCYEVGDDVKSQFESQFSYAVELFHEVFDSDPVREKYPLLFMNARAPGHGDMGPTLRLDLMEANRRQLVAAGVPEKNISIVDQCTSCNPEKFFSYRAEKGKTGRMMAVIGIRQDARK